MLNLAMLLEDSARNHPEQTAVVLDSRNWTYADIDAEARRVAALLAGRGIAPGDRVALSCPNLQWFPIIYYGIVKAGAVVVPMNVLATRAEVEYFLADSGAKAFFCFAGTPEMPIGEQGFSAFLSTSGCEQFFLITAASEAASPIVGAETLEQALSGRAPIFETVMRQETDPAAILYTSGTTGRPKGAVLTHSNLLLHAATGNQMLGSTDLGDTHLVVLPLSHVFAATVNMHAGFASASTLVLLPRFDPRVALRIMETGRITFLAGVPTIYWSLLNAMTDATDVARIAGSMRRALSAGAALPVPIIEGFGRNFGVTILEGYGMTEASPTITFSKPGSAARPGSAGVPIWGVDVKLVDDNGDTIDGPDRVGEILVRGHNVMRGYHNRPEETAEVLRDGWLHTGDLGRRDEDGWYYIVDRVKDLIIRGGYNVYPREVEDVLMTHEAVSLAAVIGVPDQALGEEVKAVVVAKPGAWLTENELIAWSRLRLAAYKYPRIVTFVDEIPLSATGKALKRELAR
ncbi:long-chain-fatty-acid--CoA ligase [Actinoplanes palleronii]|uniref:Long-chain-fatty-acid--CoA ligase n=1 Tax=Actinoplanes palleronii TaxID=113570 RepID=A0ABQ4B5H1_9ACTN|nr:long-chain fatty acid--CoA ligase [Actinoplanes palleronii]GIE65909.1 long-chain-fatty-acid--CoA ligase [Actinoplanes palleronii]